jgi:CMP-N,N'-diacetyllegionaminic acid synthase
MSLTVLAVVPARAGSRGVPGKNERLLAGKTLVARAADAAHASGVVDRCVLSTDSERIAELGREAGLEVPFLRPAELARDESPMQPVIEHALHEVERDGFRPDAVLVLQPTAPLRTGEHIAAAVRLLEETGADSVVTVVEIPKHLSPQYAMRISGERLEPFLPEGAAITRRQDVEPAYSRDGTVYAVRRHVLVERHDLYGADCRPLVLPADESVNIDSPQDWAAAEAILCR